VVLDTKPSLLGSKIGDVLDTGVGCIISPLFLSGGPWPKAADVMIKEKNKKTL
jgi:hypothetical protein